jgi:signal transduction histidine kinase
VGAALEHAEQGRRLNVRAVGTPDVGPGLRQGLEALEHSAVALRGMFRALMYATRDAAWLVEEIAGDVVLGLAQTFRELAAGVDAFGQLVRDEADPGKPMSSADVQAVREALEGMHEARARLDDMLLAGIPPQLLELHAAVLSTVKRLLREMDLDERVRRQVRLLRPSRGRRTRPAVRKGSASPPLPPDPEPDAETQLLPEVPREGRDKRRP